MADDDRGSINNVLLEDMQRTLGMMADGMTSIRDEIMHNIDGFKRDVDLRFGAVEATLRIHSSDLRELKTDVAVLKTDVGVLKTDVEVLKTDVGVLKTDVGEIKTRLTSVVDKLGTELAKGARRAARKRRR